MGAIETAKEVSKSSPTTLWEFTYTAILFLLGSVILFQPDGVVILSNINPQPILDQPGWIGLVTLLGAPNPLLVTKMGEWVNERESTVGQAKESNETTESDEGDQGDSEEEEKGEVEAAKVTD